RDYPSYLNGVSEHIYKTVLCLPSGSNLTTKERNRIVTTIRSYFG
ncbi:MAG TPA: pyridoxal phosphate-dependent aminotransferase, partial [Xanthomarina gelatinilytica]|nr:pyridoxal phosphate-dependent aminotransferase [Xanthomarina gelatinilytica]